MKWLMVLQDSSRPGLVIDCIFIIYERWGHFHDAQSNKNALKLNATRISIPYVISVVKIQMIMLLKL